MVKTLSQRIADSRLLLGNPYAYLDGVGGFSALPDIRLVSADKIAASRLKLQDPYAHLDEFGDFSASLPAPITALRNIGGQAVGRFATLLQNKRKHGRYSYLDIESKAIQLQRMMWQDREDIWQKCAPANPIDILDPAMAFHLLGFDYEVAEGLGQYFIDGQHVEVAGLIDDSSMEIRISRKFPHVVQNFTAAHELGHALLHDARGLHRDRPLDGSSLPQDPVETEANKFASYFLMPAKLVKQNFELLFGTDCFVLDEDTRFALSRGGFLDLNNCQTPRGLSRVLASVENYNGVRFQSLACQFQVSTETMAIRLEELGLLSV